MCFFDARGWYFALAVFGFVVAIWQFVRIVKGRLDTLDAMAADANSRFGTQFRRQDALGLDDCIMFDRNARKLLIVIGSNLRVEDFSFIRRFGLHWEEVSNLKTGSLRYNNVRIEFETTDWQHPVMRFKCLSKQQGDAWKARLGALLA